VKDRGKGWALFLNIQLYQYSNLPITEFHLLLYLIIPHNNFHLLLNHLHYYIIDFDFKSMILFGPKLYKIIKYLTTFILHVIIRT